jgi:hypothetical protein
MGRLAATMDGLEEGTWMGSERESACWGVRRGAMGGVVVAGGEQPGSSCALGEKCYCSRCWIAREARIRPGSKGEIKRD